MTKQLLLVAFLGVAPLAAQRTAPGWVHIAAPSPRLELPNSGTQQTSATVFDIDKDGVNDFVITERTQAPAVLWYRRVGDGWKRHVLESAALRPEAGATYVTGQE